MFLKLNIFDAYSANQMPQTQITARAMRNKSLVLARNGLGCLKTSSAAKTSLAFSIANTYILLWHGILK
jgi:hypothetical protein